MTAFIPLRKNPKGAFEKAPVSHMGGPVVAKRFHFCTGEKGDSNVKPGLHSQIKTKKEDV